MSDAARPTGPGARRGPLRACLVSAGCFIRGLPLFFCTAPKTPLRVLGLIAFDMLSVLRHSRPLPRARVGELAMLLDFQGCTNAAWDGKEQCDAECQVLRQRLDEAGLSLCLEAYLGRLRDFESHRPRVGGGDGRFDEVRSYREAVARLSIATAAAIALSRECGEDIIRTADCDPDVDTLFRILMQCQIIDDVLDYREDLAAGLPSFLTVSASLPQAMALTAGAARSYAARGDSSSGDAVLPLRMALRVVTALAKLVVRGGDRRYRINGYRNS